MRHIRLVFATLLFSFLSGCVGYYGPNTDEDGAATEDNAVLEDGYSYEASCDCVVRPMLIGGEVIFVDPSGRHRHRGLWDRHPLNFRAQQRVQNFTARRQVFQQQGQQHNFGHPGFVPQQQRVYPAGGGFHPQPQMRPAPVYRAPPPQPQRRSCNPGQRFC